MLLDSVANKIDVIANHWISGGPMWMESLDYNVECQGFNQWGRATLVQPFRTYRSISRDGVNRDGHVIYNHWLLCKRRRRIGSSTFISVPEWVILYLIYWHFINKFTSAVITVSNSAAPIVTSTSSSSIEHASTHIHDKRKLGITGGWIRIRYCQSFGRHCWW